MEEKTTEQQETTVQETGENSSRPGGNQPREISMRTLVMLIAAISEREIKKKPVSLYSSHHSVSLSSRSGLIWTGICRQKALLNLVYHIRMDRKAMIRKSTESIQNRSTPCITLMMIMANRA